MSNKIGQKDEFVPGKGEDEFTQKILSHYESIYKKIFAKTQDRYLAEDIIQETMVKALVNIDKMKQYANLKKALCTTAENLLNSHYRKHNRVNVLDFERTGTLTLLEKQRLYEKLAIEEHYILYDAINTLPQNQAQVLMLHHWSRMTFKEIGKYLNINENTAASRYRRALINLRKYYELDPKSGNRRKPKSTQSLIVTIVMLMLIFLRRLSHQY